MRRLVPIACVLACVSVPASAAADARPAALNAPASSASGSSQASGGVSGEQILQIANALPRVRALRAEHPQAAAFLTTLPDGRRQVLYYQPTPGGASQEIGQVTFGAGSGRVLEDWTGIQLQWPLARGYPGYVGGHASALYIWLPLCLLFLLPFFDFRRPLSLLHLDLLVLLSFSVSFAFFNNAHIHASVPLVYPPLLYLLVRMLALMRRASVRGDARPLRLLVPARWLAVGVLLLICFRVALNLSDSRVIDVGDASLAGAQRIADGQSLYGYSSRFAHADAYGPVVYEAYVPFQQIFGWSAAHTNRLSGRAAAIVFDLLSVGLLFVLGRRVRGPTLGIALAYAWVSYPFTLLALEADTNDALVSVLVLAALLAATYSSNAARGARGALAALAGLTKFAPLALAPLLATHELRELPRGRRAVALGVFLAGFAAAAALAMIPALTHSSLHTIYERTIEFEANRSSPFSAWGLYGGLGGVQSAVQVAVIVFALVLAVVPRRPDLVGLAAGCAAVTIAAQLSVTHWFYLYIPWFFPLVMLALLGRLAGPRASRDVASAPVRFDPSAPAA